MKKKIVSLMRVIRILYLFGIVGGIQYIIYFNRLERGIKEDKKRICLKYAGHDLEVRAGSTDLRLAESILVGKFIDRKWQGEYDIVEKYIKEIKGSMPIIIDAGANIGLFSRLIINRCPNAYVYAIEPENENYGLLCRNVQNMDKVGLMRKGVWSREGNLKVITRETGDWGFIVCEADENDKNIIESISISTLIEDNHISKIDLLKMDIEGSEYEIFNSDDLDWLDICQAIVIETHDHIVKGVDKLVSDKMREKGYIKYSYEENDMYVKRNKQEM